MELEGRDIIEVATERCQQAAHLLYDLEELHQRGGTPQQRQEARDQLVEVRTKMIRIMALCARLKKQREDLEEA